jgi:hypothetical protein
MPLLKITFNLSRLYTYFPLSLLSLPLPLLLRTLTRDRNTWMREVFK